jgi:hypothetical protein
MSVCYKGIIATLVLALSQSLFSMAQPFNLLPVEQQRYRKMSKDALRAPADVSRTPYHLASYLTRNAHSELEKVRSIFVWVANNITYDMKSFRAGTYPDYHVRAVLKRKSAVCEGYARLFKALCTEADVPCEIIHGYSKGYGYQPAAGFQVSNHAWNAVMIEGEWYLVDATWAATSMNTEKVKRPINDNYFLASPEEFLLDHLPEIKAWQLVNTPISLADFEQGDEAVKARLRVGGNYQFKDSLNHLLGLDASMRTIEYQKRASLFNPKNSGSDYHMGVEYLYRGLDSLALLNQITDAEIESKIPLLEQRIFAMFSEAAFHFSGVKPSSPYYESAQTFLDETIYERGVFKYEVAHRLLRLYADFNTDLKKTQYQRYEGLIDQYFVEAKSYFLQVPFDSWYYEDAMSYVNHYLQRKFSEL